MLSEMVEKIAQHARSGNLAGINDALDLMLLDNVQAFSILKGRARADASSSRLKPLPKLACDPLPEIAAYNASPPRLAMFGVRSRRRKAGA